MTSPGLTSYTRSSRVTKYTVTLLASVKLPRNANGNGGAVGAAAAAGAAGGGGGGGVYQDFGANNAPACDASAVRCASAMRMFAASGVSWTDRGMFERAAVAAGVVEAANDAGACAALAARGVSAAASDDNTTATSVAPRNLSACRLTGVFTAHRVRQPCACTQWAGALDHPRGNPHPAGRVFQSVVSKG